MSNKRQGCSRCYKNNIFQQHSGHREQSVMGYNHQITISWEIMWLVQITGMILNRQNITHQAASMLKETSSLAVPFCSISHRYNWNYDPVPCCAWGNNPMQNCSPLLGNNGGSSSSNCKRLFHYYCPNLCSHTFPQPWPQHLQHI